jgi:hypothetical protein
MRTMKTNILFAIAAFALTSPAMARAQASTVCNDGTTTASVGRGTCSGHGGIDRKATAAASKAARSAAKAATQVTCSDGTTSNGGRGACSHHGGIQGSVVTPPPAPRAPSLPMSVPANSPARTRSNAQSRAPSATRVSSRRGEDNDPTDAIAQCKDGLYSHAANHRGACSRHGGVAKFLKP